MTEDPADYRYWKLKDAGVIVRSEKSGCAELTEDGWQQAPHFVSRIAEGSGAIPQKNLTALRRRCVQRLNCYPLDAEAKPSASRFGLTRFRRWLVPPLEYGAPMRIASTDLQDAAEKAYLDQLRDNLGPQDPKTRINLTPEALDELIEQARDGYERQGERTAGFERRAGLFQNTASLTGGLVLAGSTLLVAEGTQPKGIARWLVLVGLVALSGALLLSGWRAYQVSLYTLSWARPNIRRKIRARAKLGDLFDIKLSLLLALLLAQDRGQTIAEWKLARLKQATWWFVVAVLASIFVSVVYLASVL